MPVVPSSIPMPALPISMVGVNVYRDGEPLKGAGFAIQASGVKNPILGVTPAGGYVEVPIMVPTGTEVLVEATHNGEIQQLKVTTAAYSGAAMAEFHFKTNRIPLYVGVAIAAGLGLWYFLKK